MMPIAQRILEDVDLAGGTAAVKMKNVEIPDGKRCGRGYFSKDSTARALWIFKKVVQKSFEFISSQWMPVELGYLSEEGQPLN